MQRQTDFPQHQIEDVFAGGDAEASMTRPIQSSALRKGGFVNIHDNPCKIVEISSFKVGKHGHAKVGITGLDLFTDKKYQIVHPSTHCLLVPDVKRTEYIVVDAGEFMSLMDDKGHLRSDLRTPSDHWGEQIKDKLKANKDETISVTILSAMGKERVIDVKTGKE